MPRAFPLRISTTLGGVLGAKPAQHHSQCVVVVSPVRCNVLFRSSKNGPNHIVIQLQGSCGRMNNRPLVSALARFGLLHLFGFSSTFGGLGRRLAAFGGLHEELSKDGRQGGDNRGRRREKEGKVNGGRCCRWSGSRWCREWYGYHQWGEIRN